MRSHACILLILFACVVSCARGRPPQVARAQAEAVEPLPAPRVHFPTGSDRVIKSERRLLAGNARWMEGNPGAVFVLEGHCDERGGDRYNMQLGDLRARSVKAALMREGIDTDRMIMIVSRGERRPLDPRHTAEAWRRNRRVEFIVR